MDVHTRLVCEAMLSDESFRALDEESRFVLFWAALLHDVGKPATTAREDDGRVTSRGHSRRGEVMARQILWRMNVPFAAREAVAQIIRFHQIPFFLIEREDARRRLYQVSQSARCDLLALVAGADARGRVCEDPARLLDNVALFAELAREEGCLDSPRRFPSDHSRFLYFRKEGRDPDYAAFDDTACEVVMMSGLPGAGKSRWAAENLAGLPQVCLDDVRRGLKIRPADNQGEVVQRARELARAHLRRRESFVWNATGITRQQRAQAVDLFASYNARVRIVYVEATEESLFGQNAGREAAVPAAVIGRLLDKWEIPDLTEAHRVDYVVPA